MSSRLVEVSMEVAELYSGEGRARIITQSPLFRFLASRIEEVMVDFEQLSGGYCHMRDDDHGDEPDHELYPSELWKVWEKRHGYLEDYS